jgi:hypothetical protein
MKRPEILGYAKDGTPILKQAGKPTHFTPEQLRPAVQAVKAAEPTPVSMQDPFTRVLGQIDPAVLKDYGS